MGDGLMVQFQRPHHPYIGLLVLRRLLVFVASSTDNSRAHSHKSQAMSASHMHILLTNTSWMHLQTVPITETRTVPAGGPGTRTGQVTCSIHGYEGDFVEATAFCCTLGHGHGNYNYGPGYDTGSSYDSYDSYGGSDDGYEMYDGQVQSQTTAGQVQLPQSAKVKRAGGRKQTVAKAIDNAAAVPDGTLLPAAPAAGSRGFGQGQQAVQHVQYLETNSGPAPPPPQRPAAAQRQQQAGWSSGGGSGAAAPSPPAAAPATTGMGGFALRRVKRAQSVGGVRAAAAVAVASAADDLHELQEQQLEAAEQQHAEDQPVRTVQPVAASGELFVSSRAAALREALAKAQ